jgi:hypothetical protein
VCGLVLDTVTRGRRELKRLVYLQIPAPREIVVPVVMPAKSPVAIVG